MTTGAGGPGNIRGVTLQLVVACDAALRLALDPTLSRLRVEGTNDIADLELWAGDRLVKLTQVKSRAGHRPIGSAELAELIRRFADADYRAEAYELVTDTIVSSAAHLAIGVPSVTLGAGGTPTTEERRQLDALGLASTDDVLARLVIRQRYGDPEYLMSGPRARAVDALAGTGAPVERVIASVDRLFAELTARAGSANAAERFISADEVREIIGIEAAPAIPERPVASHGSRLHELPVLDTRLLERSGPIADLCAGFSDLTGAATQALTGLPGCGKTELAIRVGHDLADRYEVAWWVRADEPSSVVDGFRRLLKAVGDSTADQVDERDVLRRTIEVLRQRGPWLLILDDVPTPTALRDLGLPSNGHVLVTSRHPSWQPFGAAHEVGVFDPKESRKTLLTHRPNDEASEAEALAHALGHLPLAVTQAAAYLQLSGRSIADFRRLLRTRMDILDVPDAVALAEGRYEHSVVATLDLLLDELPHGATTTLVGLLAQLAPTPIPRWLLLEGAQSAPPELAVIGDDRELDVVVGALNSVAILRASPDGLLMHPLTARAARERVANEENAVLRCAALDMMLAAFPPDALDTSSWTRSSSLLPHAHALLDAPGTLDDPNGAWLAVRVCAVDQIQGRLDDAERRAREALGAAAAHDDGRLRAQLKHIIGRVGLKSGRFDESVPWLVEALQELRNRGEQDTLAYATIEVTLGAMLSVLEDPEAEHHLQHALAIQRAELDPDDPRISRTLIEIGGDRHGHLDFVGAEVHERQALEIVDRPGTTAGVDLARGLGNLAGTLSEMPERRDEALRVAERALEVTREVYGAEHPEVAYPMTSIADLIGKDDWERAFDLLVEALRLRESALGPQHEQVGYTLQHLGCALMRSGDAERALPWLEQAHELLLDLFGDMHTEVASVQFDLAQALAALGRRDEAAALARRVLPVIADAWGARHPEVLIVERFLESR